MRPGRARFERILHAPTAPHNRSSTAANSDNLQRPVLPPSDAKDLVKVELHCIPPPYFESAQY